MEASIKVARVMVENVKVLHIEDDEEDRQAAKELLENEHVALFSVKSLEVGLEQMRHETFDIVLLDLNLPRFKDLEALRSYKQFDGTTPVIVVSGSTDIDMHERATQMGAVEFVSKKGAFQPDVLYRIIRRVFNTVVKPVEARLDRTISILRADAASFLGEI